MWRFPPKTLRVFRQTQLSELVKCYAKNARVIPLEHGARKLIGDELQLIQFGGMPRDTKSFKGIGSGVLEIAVRYDKDAYRTVVAVQLGKKLYVLHAFQKKSKRGIETPKRDIELIKRRYREAKELAGYEEKEN